MVWRKGNPLTLLVGIPNKVKVKSLSRVRLLVTPWTAAYQALPSMGFSRQEYWSGVPLPSPWNSKQVCFKSFKSKSPFSSTLFIDLLKIPQTGQQFGDGI